MPEDERGSGEHPNSILAKADAATRRKMAQNMKKHSEDAKALEAWAEAGFTSETQDLSEEVDLDPGFLEVDVLR